MSDIDPFSAALCLFELAASRSPSVISETPANSAVTPANTNKRKIENTTNNNERVAQVTPPMNRVYGESNHNNQFGYYGRNSPRQTPEPMFLQQQQQQQQRTTTVNNNTTNNNGQQHHHHHHHHHYHHHLAQPDQNAPIGSPANSSTPNNTNNNNPTLSPYVVQQQPQQQQPLPVSPSLEPARKRNRAISSSVSPSVSPFVTQHLVDLLQRDERHSELLAEQSSVSDNNNRSNPGQRMLQPQTPLLPHMLAHGGLLPQQPQPQVQAVSPMMQPQQLLLPPQQQHHHQHHHHLTPHAIQRNPATPLLHTPSRPDESPLLDDKPEAMFDYTEIDDADVDDDVHGMDSPMTSPVTPALMLASAARNGTLSPGTLSGTGGKVRIAHFVSRLMNAAIRNDGSVFATDEGFMLLNEASTRYMRFTASGLVNLHPKTLERLGDDDVAKGLQAFKTIQRNLEYCGLKRGFGHRTKNTTCLFTFGSEIRAAKGWFKTHAGRLDITIQMTKARQEKLKSTKRG